MSHNSSTSFQTPEVLYNAFFDALPGNHYLLKNDAPQFTILAVSSEHLQATGAKTENVIGKGLFEAYPSNTHEPNDTGEINMRASLAHVMLHKEPNGLPIQRYDVAKEDGSFLEKYWKATNNPVFSPDGELVSIIYSAVDITDQVTAGQLGRKT